MIDGGSIARLCYGGADKSQIISWNFGRRYNGSGTSSSGILGKFRCYYTCFIHHYGALSILHFNTSTLPVYHVCLVFVQVWCT